MNPYFINTASSRSSTYPKSGEMRKYVQKRSTGIVINREIGSNAETTVEAAKRVSVDIMVIRKVLSRLGLYLFTFILLLYIGKYIIVRIKTAIAKTANGNTRDSAMVFTTFMDILLRIAEQITYPRYAPKVLRIISE